MIGQLRAGRPPKWLIVTLSGLAWAAALAAITPIVHGYLTNPPDQRLVDLDVYRTGGLAVLHGQPLYSVLTQPPQLLPFTYPPVAAIFAAPLAMMSWPAAQLVWVPFVYVPFAVIIGYSFRPLLRRAGPWRWVLFAALFCAGCYLFPMQDEIRFGQVDAVLAALAVADCAAVRPRWPRGALVGLATAVKLVPGVFIIYLLLSGRRRAARTAVLAALAWTAGAFLLLPRDSVTYWTSAIFDSGRLGDNAGTENQSLRGLLLRFFLPGQAPGVLWVLIAVAVAVPGFLLARRLAREQWEIAGIAVTALLLVLVSPVAWIHYFLLVVIAIGALVGDGRRFRRVLTAAGAAVFFGLTVPWWGQSLLHDPAVPRVVSRLVEGAFGLAAAALMVIIARTRMTGADRAPGAGDDGSPGSPAEAGDVGSSPGLDRLSSV
ncbi:MAG TPA: glycosyltransferase family 87 protein [Streptosporangiaceae bacterium]|nr:glycosyltransferase family 87 protein [Streptosporangiaceae bacterium]